jgi:hypothetical protein
MYQGLKPGGLGFQAVGHSTACAFDSLCIQQLCVQQLCVQQLCIQQLCNSTEETKEQLLCKKRGEKTEKTLYLSEARSQTAVQEEEEEEET